MRSKDTNLYRVINRTQASAKAELIMVPPVRKLSERIALLRSVQIPEYAFVMWFDISTSTRSQIGFNWGVEGISPCFPVVCACCPSELYGLSINQKESSAKQTRKLRATFSKSLGEKCRTYGIHSIFMRKASVWSSRYEEIRGLEIINARKFHKTMIEHDTPKMLQASFRFIDFKNSRGLGM